MLGFFSHLKTCLRAIEFLRNKKEDTEMSHKPSAFTLAQIASFVVNTHPNVVYVLHIIPQSSCFTLGFPLAVVYFMNLDKYMTCICHYNTECFYSLEIPVYPVYSSLPSLKPWKPLIFFTVAIFAFLRVSYSWSQNLLI